MGQGAPSPHRMCALSHTHTLSLSLYRSVACLHLLTCATLLHGGLACTFIASQAWTILDQHIWHDTYLRNGMYMAVGLLIMAATECLLSNAGVDDFVEEEEEAEEGEDKGEKDMEEGEGRVGENTKLLSVN